MKKNINVKIGYRMKLQNKNLPKENTPLIIICAHVSRFTDEVENRFC